MQDALARELDEEIAGYKLGLSSSSAMERSGLGRPARGFMVRSRIKDAGAVLPAVGQMLVEVEVAFVIGRPIAPGERVGNLEDVISGAYLAVEIVRSRFRDRSAVGLPSFIGDSVGFHALVLGDALPMSARSALLGAPAELFLNGERVAAALSGPERTDPFAAFGLFMVDAADAGLPIDKGFIVTTGTLVAPFESDERGTYEARLGDMSVTFSV